MLLPIVLTMAVGAPLAGRTLDRAGSRVVVIGGNALVAGGMMLAGLVATQLVGFYVAAALLGVGLGVLLGAPLRYIMLGEAAPGERAAAQGALTLFSSTGQLVGGAAVGAIAASQGGGVPGYERAYFAIGVLAAVFTVLAFGLKSQAAERSTARANQEAGAAHSQPAS